MLGNVQGDLETGRGWSLQEEEGIKNGRGGKGELNEGEKAGGGDQEEHGQWETLPRTKDLQDGQPHRVGRPSLLQGLGGQMATVQTHKFTSNATLGLLIVPTRSHMLERLTIMPVPFLPDNQTTRHVHNGRQEHNRHHSELPPSPLRLMIWPQFQG